MGNFNGSEDNPEGLATRRAQNRIKELVTAKRSADAIIEAESAFRRMRRYSCAGAAQILQHAGQAVLRLLWQDAERTREPAEARRMLLLAVEALASSLRYSEGSGQERQKRKEFQGWVKSALKHREEKGLASVELPLKRELPDMGFLGTKALSLVEWLPNT